jgi:CHASE2 domain-containing sensor protein
VPALRHVPVVQKQHLLAWAGSHCHWLLFQWAVFVPGVIDPPMPWLLALVFSLMGLALALAGCMAIWFKWHRQRVAESTIVRRQCLSN